MIDYHECDKAQLIEVLEFFAYELARWQHPHWYEIPEETIISLLKEQNLPVHKF